jgi:hypothetical protein
VRPGSGAAALVVVVVMTALFRLEPIKQL